MAGSEGIALERGNVEWIFLRDDGRRARHAVFIDEDKCACVNFTFARDESLRCVSAVGELGFFAW